MASALLLPQAATWLARQMHSSHGHGHQGQGGAAPSELLRRSVRRKPAVVILEEGDAREQEQEQEATTEGEAARSRQQEDGGWMSPSTWLRLLSCDDRVRTACVALAGAHLALRALVLPLLRVLGRLI